MAKKSKKLILVRDDLLEKAAKITSREGRRLFSFTNEAFERAIEAYEADATLAEVLDFYKMMKNRKGSEQEIQHVKKLRKEIEDLEKEKESLLKEIEDLKTKAEFAKLKEESRPKRWTQMNRKQILAVTMLGIILTSFILIVTPLLVEPFVSATLPLSTLNQETKLVSYLRAVQHNNNVYVGVHGCDHTCPICGSNDHEFVCPHGNVSLEEIQRRVDAGLAIFYRSGLKADFYAFPGEACDQRTLSVLRSMGFMTFKYQAADFEELDGVVSLSVSNLTPNFRLKEFTWMWRNAVSESYFQATLRELDTDKPIQILMHIQDVTNQTCSLLEYAVLHDKTTLIRCDDITSNDDLAKVKQLVELTTKHNVTLLLAVIPIFRKTIQSPFLEASFKTTWIVFMGSFILPAAVMMPWAVIFRAKREKLRLTGNPHYATVSIILPAYNEEKTIARSIEQGLNQDYKGNVEIIVIDDGSTDKTCELAKKYADTCSNVKVIRHPENRGKSYALNTGFAEAKGEISIFSDTDSALASDTVSKMLPHFKDPKVGMVAGMIVVKNEKNLLTHLQQIEYLLSQAVMRFCQSSHKNVLICPGASTAVRTSIARRIPSTNRTVTEDADFTFSVWKDGWKISQEPEAISYTEAPENLKDFLEQRKRWFYGGLQTMSIHKWAAKKGNLWVIKAWLECFLCPFALLSFVFGPLVYFLLASSFPILYVAYAFLPVLILCITGVVGIRLYNSGEKTRLGFLIPIYAVYQVFLNLLLVYVVFAFVSRKGIYVRHGGKIVHAI